MKYIVVIECTDAGGIEIGTAILQMGYRPLFLLNPESYKADIALFLQNFEYKHVNTDSVDDIIDVLNPIKHQIAGVGTLVDSRITIATNVALNMKLPGPDQACINLKDKSFVANLVENFSKPTFSLTANDESNKQILLVTFKDKPVVAKLRTGCGAVGIQFLKSNEDKIRFLSTITKPEEWLIQEYFSGKLYSMEGWVQNHHVNFLGWTSRKKIKNTETEFRFEGFNTIDLDLTRKAKEAIKLLFKKSSMSHGWFHIEFLIDLNQGELTIIDANIGRVGGAMMPHVLAKAFNISPSDIYQHALEIQIFGKTSIFLSPTPKLNRIYKCICFGSPKEMIIDEVIFPKYPLETDGLRMVRILGCGDRVAKMGHDDMSWIGFVAGEENEVERYAAKIKLKSSQSVYHAAY